MKVVIVIPTYNESENIGRLIEILDAEILEIPNHDIHVLVVEGNSPDGTSNVVREKIKKYSWVHLLMEKEKAGLGAAYIYGFKHAMNNLKADVIIEMDADFQHDPKDISRFMAEIDKGADYVIGSRFTKGGSIPKEWALKRKILSIGGNIVSKLILGIYKVNDFTTGYKATRVKGFLNKIDLNSIISSGFAYKIELLHKMHRLGAKIVEVPIAFGMRDRGASKMESSNNSIDSLKVVVTLRVRENENFFKFIAVGFIGLFVDLTLSNLLRLGPLKANVAASTAAFIAMMVTFTFNNFWSFNDRKITSLKKLVLTFLPYAAFSFVPIGFRYWFVDLIISKYGETLLTYNFGIFVSVIFGLVWNFVVYSKIIWRKK